MTPTLARHGANTEIKTASQLTLTVVILYVVFIAMLITICGYQRIAPHVNFPPKKGYLFQRDQQRLPILAQFVPFYKPQFDATVHISL